MKKLLLCALVTSGAYLQAQTEIHPTTGPIHTTNTAPVGGKTGFLDLLASAFGLTPAANKALTQEEVTDKIQGALQSVNSLLQSSKLSNLKISDDQVNGIFNTLKGYANSYITGKKFLTGINLGALAPIVDVLKNVFAEITKADSLTASAARPGEQIRTASNAQVFLNLLRDLFKNHNDAVENKSTEALSLDQPLEDVKVQNSTYTIQDLLNLVK